MIWIQYFQLVEFVCLQNLGDSCTLPFGSAKEVFPLWITWITFILWIFMILKIGLIIVHGFMNATIKNYGYDQWLLTINVHGHIYEHTSCMINDHRYRYEHWSSWSMIKGKTYEHRSSIIINHKWHSSRSMIVAMKCRWSYMISVDQWVISWSLGTTSKQLHKLRLQSCLSTNACTKSYPKHNCLFQHSLSLKDKYNSAFLNITLFFGDFSSESHSQSHILLA